MWNTSSAPSPEQGEAAFAKAQPAGDGSVGVLSTKHRCRGEREVRAERDEPLLRWLMPESAPSSSADRLDDLFFLDTVLGVFSASIKLVRHPGRLALNPSNRWRSFTALASVGDQIGTVDREARASFQRIRQAWPLFPSQTSPRESRLPRSSLQRSFASPKQTTAARFAIFMTRITSQDHSESGHARS